MSIHGLKDNAHAATTDSPICIENGANLLKTKIHSTFSDFAVLICVLSLCSSSLPNAEVPDDEGVALGCPKS